MKNILQLLILTSLIVSCANIEKKEVFSDIENAKHILSKEINKIIEETGIPSISIALIKDEDVVWAEAFGYANVKTKTPAIISTTYSTGSTVKPFMSMAIMQLVEKNILDLDIPVNNYLKIPIPSYSESNKPITLRHLLSHQSGIPSAAEFIPLWSRDKRKTLEEIVTMLKPVREPEEKHEYCNNGYVVAALVIETQTGISYNDYVNQNILRPLGLEHINFAEPTPEMVESMAFPYKLLYNNASPVNQLYSQPYPSGGYTYLTPLQMSKFLIAHLNSGIYSGNKLLNAELMKQFHETSFEHEYYGLGIGIEKKNNNTYLFHNGLQEGYSSAFKINLDNKSGVYLTANAASEIQINALADLASELMDGNREVESLPSFSVKEFTEIDISKTEMNAYIGNYRIDGTNFNINIIKRKDTLFFENPKGELLEIIPFVKDGFFFKAVEARIEFMVKDNKVIGLKYFASNDFTASKLE